MENTSNLLDSNCRNDYNHAQLFEMKIWRIKDVAEYLQCSVKTIYNKTSKGEIPHIKKGKTLYFQPDEIENWLMEGNL